MTKKRYITYDEYNELTDVVRTLQHVGTEYIHKKSLISLIGGSVCLTIAIIPNGLGIIFYPLAFLFFAHAGVDISTILLQKKIEIKQTIKKIRRFFSNYK